eukprot:279642-Pelagomonas_calceolata.AAC.2
MGSTEVNGEHSKSAQASARSTSLTQTTHSKSYTTPKLRNTCKSLCTAHRTMLWHCRWNTHMDVMLRHCGWHTDMEAKWIASEAVDLKGSNVYAMWLNHTATWMAHSHRRVLKGINVNALWMARSHCRALESSNVDALWMARSHCRALESSSVDALWMARSHRRVLKGSNVERDMVLHLSGRVLEQPWGATLLHTLQDQGIEYKVRTLGK